MTLIPRIETAGPEMQREGGFVCVVCGKDTSNGRWQTPNTPSVEISPICCCCERVSGYDWAGRARYRTKPTSGSFMDRRNATRILALAEELSCAAKKMEWSRKHGIA